MNKEAEESIRVIKEMGLGYKLADSKELSPEALKERRRIDAAKSNKRKNDKKKRKQKRRR